MSSKLRIGSVGLAICSLVLLMGVSEIRAQSTGCTSGDCIATGTTAPSSTVTINMNPLAEIGLCVRTINSGGLDYATANSVTYTWNVRAATNTVTNLSNAPVTPDYTYIASDTYAAMNGVKVAWAVTSSGQPSALTGDLTAALVSGGTTGRTFEGKDSTFASATTESALGTALDVNGSQVVTAIPPNQSLCSGSFTGWVTNGPNGPFNCVDGSTLDDRAIIGKVLRSDENSIPVIVGATYTYSIPN